MEAPMARPELRTRWVPALLALAIVGVLALAPFAHASDTRLVVDDDGRAKPGNCNASQSAFTRIQAAVDAADPGNTIHVCAGTFDEQVVVTKADLRIVGAGSGRTKVRPSVGNVNTVALGVGPGGVPPGPSVAILLVDGVTGVDLSELTVDGSAATLPSDCPPYLGIYYRGASGTVKSLRVTGVLRCDSVGIFAQSPLDGTGAARVAIRDAVVDNYGLVGIICDQIGTDCTIRSSTIAGLGEPSETASGVQVSRGAGARVTDNVVRGNLCGLDVCGPDPVNQFQTAGILTFQAAQRTVISENAFSKNDVGVYLIEGDGCCRTNENTLTDNRYFGIVIQDGRNTTSENEISGGNVGVAAVAVSADAVATSRSDDISRTAVAPVATFSCCGFTAKVNQR